MEVLDWTALKGQLPPRAAGQHGGGMKLIEVKGGRPQDAGACAVARDLEPDLFFFVRSLFGYGGTLPSVQALSLRKRKVSGEHGLAHGLDSWAKAQMTRQTASLFPATIKTQVYR